MDKTRITYLHERYLQNILTQAELEDWKLVLNDESAQPLIKQLVDGTWEQLAVKDLAPLPEGRSEAIMENVLEVPKAKLSKTLWSKVAIAAAVATIIVSAGMWFIKREAVVEPTEVSVKNDVAPGKQGATLTLASGKKIRLSDAANGELAEEAGVSITKSADGQLVYEVKGSANDPNQINTLSTAVGETYQVKLPDGSKVYLNAASSLTYAASLVEQGKRVVRLKGEGYFEVFKDKVHPFVVKTEQQDVEVLGTHFNINAYADEGAVRTTLVEGSVKVNNSTILKPGQQSILSESGKIAVQEVNMENITDWKDGDFNLDGLDLRTAMRKIARWYDVEVIYDGSVPAGIKSGGWISRDTQLSSILKVIERSGQVHFKVEGRRVYVSR